jgi:major membrane immunogen (membrane-anchored lipoprotein)
VNKLRTRHLAVILSASALTAAACGSSSKQAASPTGSQPATPGTSSTSSTGGITASTPITDPAYRAGLIKGEQNATQGKFTKAQLGQLADCAIKKLQAQGITTVGQALQHQSEFRNLGAQCARELGLNAK